MCYFLVVWEDWLHTISFSLIALFNFGTISELRTKPPWKAGFLTISRRRRRRPSPCASFGDHRLESFWVPRWKENNPNMSPFSLRNRWSFSQFIVFLYLYMDYWGQKRIDYWIDCLYAIHDTGVKGQMKNDRMTEWQVTSLMKIKQLQVRIANSSCTGTCFASEWFPATFDWWFYG